MKTMLDTLNPFSGYFKPMLSFSAVDDGAGAGDGAGSGAGAGTATWIDAFPDEAKKDADFTKYKEPAELYKAWNERKELIGRKGIIVPKDDAPPEEWDKYKTALGVPQKPEDYKFDKVENLHKEMNITPEFETNFKGKMHKAGVPAKQANEIYKDYLGEINQALQNRDAQLDKVLKEQETQLRKDWGQNYEANLQMSNRLIKKFGGEDGIRDFGDLSRKPGVMKFLANVGKRMSEDSISRSGFSSFEGGEMDAKKQIVSIRNDAKSAYNDEKHPNHHKAVLEMRELYKVAYPEGE